MKVVSGEQCPACGRSYSKIVDTRIRHGYRFRRRECLSCGARWSTVEVRAIEEEVKTWKKSD